MAGSELTLCNWFCHVTLCLFQEEEEEEEEEEQDMVVCPLQIHIRIKMC